jgi:exosortase
LDEGLKRTERFGSQNIWISDDVNIHPTARLYGPIVIMQGSDISRGAVIIGPTMIGRDVRIGENSIVINSALWDDSKVSSNCEIRGCIIDYQVDIPCHRTIQDQSIPFQPRKIFIDLFSGALKLARNNIGSLNRALQKPLAKINECLPNWVKLHKSKFVTFVLGLLLISTFLWSYWPDILDLWDIWQRSDEYSSGLLVPFLSIYILWSRRQSIAQYKVKPSVWGLFAFVAAQAFRLFGLFFMFASAERLSIVLSIAALVLFLFGWQLFKKVFTILIFLFLMLPWPNRVQAAVALPLQRWATSSAVFCLEMMGCEAVQEGNIIHIGSSSVAVVEACNGLRMVTAFFVISGLVVLIVRRKLWEKAIVLASSLPIALICNTVRLTITALAFTVVSGEYWEKIFHDFGGYAMMPLALAMVVAELWLLTKLTTAPVEKNVVVVNRQKR